MNHSISAFCFDLEATYMCSLLYCLLSPPGKRYVVWAMTVWHWWWEKYELILTVSCISAPTLAVQLLPCMDEWTIKDTEPYCQLFFKINLFTDMCLTDFTDWRYIHSWLVFSTQLVNCCHGRRKYKLLVATCHSFRFICFYRTVWRHEQTNTLFTLFGLLTWTGCFLK